MRESSKSDHHEGYGLVLACISNMAERIPLDRDCARDNRRRRVEEEEGGNGSTCTMCSHSCTIDLINDVFPEPNSGQLLSRLQSSTVV